MSIEVIDNFLDQDYFNFLKGKLLSDQHWTVLDCSVGYEEDEGNHNYNAMMVKVLHGPEGCKIPELLPVMRNLWDDLGAFSIARMKLNLTFASPGNYEFGWHEDYKDLEGWRSAVLYLHDTDGGLRILRENGDVLDLEAKANRLITFPVNRPHTGLTHTNAKLRAVLNVVYYPDKEEQ